MNAIGITELDVHGMNTYQAKTAIDSALKRAGGEVYRIRVIHGYQRGTVLRNMIRSAYKKHPKVLRVELSLNQGQTELVLKE
ncbi:MAG: Smr/MutS family protein [Clostridiales bacterium]|jgi:DNA-nicking Smr family endonuclease|nr:Smr/MutS family protein [Clostridiales bacterium]